MKPELTQERLKELLHYDPETGHFTRRASQRHAGCHNACGYRQISIDNKPYLSHRLAFLYMTGSFPPADTDHINRVRDDNRWINLRPATRRENAKNKGLSSNSTSGYPGVAWDKSRGKWLAYGTRDGRTRNLGRFDSIEYAAEVARKWREENFGDFAGYALE